MRLVDNRWLLDPEAYDPERDRRLKEMLTAEQNETLKQLHLRAYEERKMKKMKTEQVEPLATWSQLKCEDRTFLRLVKMTLCELREGEEWEFGVRGALKMRNGRGKMQTVGPPDGGNLPQYGWATAREYYFTAVDFYTFENAGNPYGQDYRFERPILPPEQMRYNLHTMKRCRPATVYETTTPSTFWEELTGIYPKRGPHQNKRLRCSPTFNNGIVPDPGKIGEAVQILMSYMQSNPVAMPMMPMMPSIPAQPSQRPVPPPPPQRRQAVVTRKRIEMDDDDESEAESTNNESSEDEDDGNHGDDDNSNDDDDDDDDNNDEHVTKTTVNAIPKPTPVVAPSSLSTMPFTAFTAPSSVHEAQVFEIASMPSDAFGELLSSKAIASMNSHNSYNSHASSSSAPTSTVMTGASTTNPPATSVINTLRNATLLATGAVSNRPGFRPTGQSREEIAARLRQMTSATRKIA